MNEAHKAIKDYQTEYGMEFSEHERLIFEAGWHYATLEAMEKTKKALKEMVAP